MGLRCRRCRNRFPHLVSPIYIQYDLHELDNNVHALLVSTLMLLHNNHFLLFLKMQSFDTIHHLFLIAFYYTITAIASTVWFAVVAPYV